MLLSCTSVQAAESQSNTAVISVNGKTYSVEKGAFFVYTCYLDVSKGTKDLLLPNGKSAEGYIINFDGLIEYDKSLLSVSSENIDTYNCFPSLKGLTCNFNLDGKIYFNASSATAKNKFNSDTCILASIPFKVKSSGKTKIKMNINEMMASDMKLTPIVLNGRKMRNYSISEDISCAIDIKQYQKTGQGSLNIKFDNKYNNVPKKIFYKENGKWKLIGTTSKSSFSYANQNITNNKKHMFLTTTATKSLPTDIFDGIVSNTNNTYCPVSAPVASVNSYDYIEGINISWKSIPGAQQYWLYVSKSGSSYTMVGTTSGLSYLYKNVTSGNTYSFVVYASDKKGNMISGRSNVSSAKYLEAPKISKTENTPSGIKLSWNKVKGAEKYRVFYKKGSLWLRICDTISDSCIFKDAKNNNRYNFTVRCISLDGKNYVSSFYRDNASETFFSAPTINSLTNVNNGVKIEWGKISGVGTYRVYYKTATQSWTRITDTASSSYVFKDAKPGQKYIFTVRGISNDKKAFLTGFKASSGHVFLSVPKLKSVSKVLGGLKITWERIKSAEQYRVFYRTANSSWTRIGVTKNNSVIFNTPRKNTKYIFTVRCLSADGKSYTSSFDPRGISFTY